MTPIKIYPTIYLSLLLSSYSISTAQEFTFRREVDTIPVVINGVSVTQPFAGGISSSKPALADIDNDGDPDLFVGEGAGNINFFRNIGTATNPNFVLESEYLVSSGIGFNSAPALADIDNDGDLDLFVGELFGRITFYRCMGTATNPNFMIETGIVDSIVVGFNSVPTFADIDNDGDLDLFVGGAEGNISFYRNIGIATNPNFELETEELVNAGDFSAPAFGDIDNDGDLDLFVGDVFGKINFYRNTTTTINLDFALVTEELINAGDFSAPVFADIDNDGDLDLFVGGGEGNISFYRNTGTVIDAAFTLETLDIISNTIDVGFLSAPTFADIDDDGDLDLIMGKGNGNLNFYRNTGTITNPIFALERVSISSIDVGNSSKPAFGDIDNDRDLDLFVGEEDGSINFYRNRGTPTNPDFKLAKESFLNAGFSSAPTFIDIDNDRDLDLFVGAKAGNIVFYRNKGTTVNPNFKLETEEFIDAEDFVTPTFVDLDNDSDSDLFSGSVFGRIAFYRNTGTVTDPIFTLTTEGFPAIDIGSSSVPAFADIDNDGDLDLFVGESDGGIHFYRNITSEVVRGDINNDGRVNVVDLIKVINFILGLPPAPTDQEIATADVNRDGKIDVSDLIAIINIILGIDSPTPN